MFEKGDAVLFQGRHYAVIGFRDRDVVIMDDEGYNLVVHPLTITHV